MDLQNIPVTTEQLNLVKVLIVGDVMLDRYWFSDVSRISPEAPVPVALIKNIKENLGGAANVARNVRALGAQASLIGAIGIDEAGLRITQLLEQEKIDAYLEQDKKLNTTIKLRILAQQQQLLRADFEGAPAHGVVKACLKQYEYLLSQHQLIILSDYAKGTLENVGELISLANKNHQKVLVDPKGEDWRRYKGATVLTPNRKELQQVVGRWHSESDLIRRATELRRELDIDTLVLTRSEEGISIFNDLGHKSFVSHALEVSDVSGAGDTVIAVLASLLASGCHIDVAVHFANRAAGIAVSKLGAETVNYEELFSCHVW